MNKILIVLSILLLTACNDVNKVEKESNVSIEQPKESNSVIKSQSNNTNDSLIKETSVSQLRDKKIENSKPQMDAQDKITCMGKTLNDWYTFDEKLEQPKCKKLNGYKIKNYQCSVEKNVFDLNSDAIKITMKDTRVFAFHSLEQCQEAVEMWEANGI
ncbi:hypothetical protein ACS125_03335 [Acinetobacter sp. PFS20]|uniref:hypothetical protein n=1 Tax=Acinetobacter sp. PFS20 TaxID=3458434 RepID=UPI003FD3081F